MHQHFSVDQAVREVAASQDENYGVLLEHGSLELGYYKPHRVDPQDPHDRDEVYIVKSGSGIFAIEDERQTFGPGDAMFVPAFVVHRFEEFTDDFAAWVIFYGPTGGE